MSLSGSGSSNAKRLSKRGASVDDSKARASTTQHPNTATALPAPLSPKFSSQRLKAKPKLVSFKSWCDECEQQGAMNDQTQVGAMNAQTQGCDECERQEPRQVRTAAKRQSLLTTWWQRTSSEPYNASKNGQEKSKKKLEEGIGRR